MSAEDERTRRHEPVIVISEGYEYEGTIEWGGVTQLASIYLEAKGASLGRIIGVTLADIRPDPGGTRPVWSSMRR